MKLHIFNPEHDIALATNVKRFTAPHAARQLRSEMGFLPALWAADGDMVMVDDIKAAEHRLWRLKRYAAHVSLVSLNNAPSLQLLHHHLGDIESVEPWGWDSGVAEMLQKAGLPKHLIPNDHQLEDIRQLSNRSWASQFLLPVVRQEDSLMTGESWYIKDFNELAIKVSDGESYVMKAPWSSSGRGIRYLTHPDHWLRNQTWARHVIERQGGIMLEPYYNKVKDFGMEFMAHADGSVTYEGLSLFQTVNGAYSGSIIDTEAEKQMVLERYVPAQLLDMARKKICEVLSLNLKNRYHGPLGVDMMIVSDAGNRWLLHPCVELNLRRTMGHVALSFEVGETLPRRLMRIFFTDKYHFRVSMVKKT
ncbi:MAG: hypothetical protein J6T11_01420 [Bacteroidaceae bacterium]|nr:hypothetical protein [Bacteroidaceae bacterium]